MKRAIKVVGVCILLASGCSGISIPAALPPALKAWAARKAVRLSQCLAEGKRGTELVSCLGNYVDDRGTYACERVRANLEGS